MDNVNQQDFSPEILKEVDRQLEIISRQTVDLLPLDEFRAKLARSIRDQVPLRIKQGFDPTSTDIHIGHAVGIRKLRQFQDLGHQIVLIVGDYTALVGDPSGQSATRPQLSHEQIMTNAETYQEQFFKILDRSRTEVVFNGDWFEKLAFSEVMLLASKYTVARILERDDFTKRMKANTPISVHELFYPLMQGYDSVAIKADLELGATEQTFNLLAGRTIQEAYGQERQCILTMPILVGTDGVKKMSKSLGNYIGVDEAPREMFGKVMSIPDECIYQYFQLATDWPPAALDEVKQKLESGKTNPMEIKRELGVTIVNMYHKSGSGETAADEFKRMFSQKQEPDDMPETTGSYLRKLGIDPDRIYLVHLIAKSNLAKSNSEARKLITAGSVRLDGEKVTDVDYEFALDREIVLKVGKRRYLRLIPN
ncbi:MAG: tyrosine--tRNA ligase [candidate division Zixibacteria bacterium]|nr:tyrosine--tRNA ligase [candidate division Zixibacteria bacterium]